MNEFQKELKLLGYPFLPPEQIPIPPNSKYFNLLSDGNIVVYLPGQIFCLDTIPPEWQYIVAALAMVGWDENFGQEVTVDQTVTLKTACQFWRWWRGQK